MSRTVVVTGGGTGIGRAVALEFAKAGDSVIVTGRRPEPLAETVELAGSSARALRCDGTDPAQVRDLAAALDGPIDVLVNNAGGNTDFDAPEPRSLEDLATRWRRNFDANVLTAVLTTEALAPKLRDDAAVIFLGSIAPAYASGAYGAAKAALAAWNITVATELGPRGIRCNVVAPGYTGDTEFFRRPLPQERLDFYRSRNLTGRLGEPSDIAATIFFLASPGARHITGQVIHVNGGAVTTR
ncbi:MAG TPA: SDR family oxidoreductase [Actinopolymorphaceae bacterium]